MSRSAVATIVFGLNTVVLAAVVLWGAFANPSVDSPSYSVPHTCLAPWDTVLNEADNWPGGEPPPDAADIAARCRAAGEQRFAVARATAIAAVATGTATLVAGIVAARRTRTHVDATPAR